MSGIGIAAAEVAKTAAKEAAKEFAKEGAKETAKGIGKELAPKAVDVSKRIDITTPVKNTTGAKIDVTKRLTPESSEFSVKDISDRIKDYISDLKSHSDFSETIKDDLLEADKLKPQSPEHVSTLREEFDENRARLRKAWEEENGKEWPKYTEDVYNDKGVKIRKVGDNYDAHHVQPLELGGTNTVENITPLDLTKHRNIHSSDGTCKKLVDAVKGAEL